MERSASTRGGWLVETSAALSTMRKLCGLVVALGECRHVRGDTWWFADTALDRFGGNFPNFAAMCKSAKRRSPAQEKAQPKPPPPKPSTDPYAVLFLTPNAPSFLIDPVRRALARNLHPDKGGSDEQMKAINVAYDEIFREPARQRWKITHEE